MLRKRLRASSPLEGDHNKVKRAKIEEDPDSKAVVRLVDITGLQDAPDDHEGDTQPSSSESEQSSEDEQMGRQQHEALLIYLSKYSN